MTLVSTETGSNCCSELNLIGGRGEDPCAMNSTRAKDL